uniref:Methyltransferase type 11 domain-containing protein n=1 Tax=Oryza barthii TaxID=65489 RepID=A0A0D3GUG9_9ORYZ
MPMPSSSSLLSAIRRLLTSLARSPPPAAAAAMPPSSPEPEEEGMGRSDAGVGGGEGGEGEAEYWDARYVEEGGAPYDWYQRYAALRPFVRRFAPPESRVLMIGCGSARTPPPPPSPPFLTYCSIEIAAFGSALVFSIPSLVPKKEIMSEDMVDDGYTEIMNIDISSVVIEIMRKKHFNIPQLQCILNRFSVLFLSPPPLKFTIHWSPYDT